MKILVDENIPLMTVSALRGMGHDVRDVRGTPDQGVDDSTLWQMAQEEGRLLSRRTKALPGAVMSLISVFWSFDSGSLIGTASIRG